MCEQVGTCVSVEGAWVFFFVFQRRSKRANGWLATVPQPSRAGGASVGLVRSF